MRPLARANWPNLYFLALPFVVATWSWGAGVTALAVVFGVLWKWAVGAARMGRRDGPAPLRFESIGASHIVEKARWHLDRLGVHYEEDRAAGVLGILGTARSVPRLWVPAGPSTSCIGDSTEILRFLWGRHGTRHAKEAAFLAPTAESLELEERMNAYAVHVRRWLYWNALPERAYMLRLWGVDDPTLPAWQRAALRLGYPLLELFIRRGLGVNEENTRESVERAKAFLGDMEARLAGGGPVLQHGPLHSIDLQLAALCGYWACAPEFGGPTLTRDYGVAPEALPPSIRAAYEDWQQKFPHTTAYVRKLYAEERAPRPRLSE